jgi:hypothetical protein
MKASKETIVELGRLLAGYEKEVERAMRQGRLTEQSAQTYKQHANYFFRWCKNDFEPGARNVNQTLF